jgi:transcription initiation factor TFIIH subunit 2
MICPVYDLFLFQLLEGFIDEFFDQNPISQMGIIITKNKRAEKLSELAGNPRKHIKVYEGGMLNTSKGGWSGSKCRVN